MTRQTILITGASDGIGAVYADRFARRGANLILVARRAEKLEALARTLRDDTGVAVEILAADLARADDLARVETRLRTDATISGLINNAGIAGESAFVESDPAFLTGMIALNVMAVARLSAAIAPRLAKRGEGTLINITSVTALMPDAFTAVYPATKAFVLAFTEALQVELGSRGVRVQAVLPGITRTAIWTQAQIANIPAHMVMDVNEMVDAALAGFDLGEAITIPTLPDNADLDAYLAARSALRPNLSHQHAAPRYGVAPVAQGDVP
jgi:short-subunit dehydrogenase